MRINKPFTPIQITLESNAEKEEMLFILRYYIVNNRENLDGINDGTNLADTIYSLLKEL